MAPPTQTGTLPVKEGVIFYEHSSATSDPSRPTLVFIHAGVASHRLWDDQVAYFSIKGWAWLRYDLFGFGQSAASSSWLASTPRDPPSHHAHLLSLVDSVLGHEARVICIGLSMGGGYALQFAVSHPERCAGVASLAGGLPGFEFDNKPEEDALFAQSDAALRDNRPDDAARLQVRIWGDGPLQNEGRFAAPQRERLMEWCKDIARHEIAGTGGMEWETARAETPAVKNLHAIRVPAAIAYGTFDETNTTEAMKFAGHSIQGAVVREFPTAHMINMEMPDETNKWLDEWLTANFS